MVKAVNQSKDFAVGIIDADKRLPTLDNGFSEFKMDGDIDGTNRHIALFINSDGRRFLFTVKPAMDKFILDAAKDQNVDLAGVGFPSTLDGFKKVTKRIQASDDVNLRKLFALISGHKELKCLRNTLKYLINMRCNADVEVVKQFFSGSLTSDDLNSELMQSK